MIPRYDKSEISKIWSDENKFACFLKAELAILKTLEEAGSVPKGTTAAFENVEIRPSRIEEIEATTRHDVIAFCSSITEQVSPEVGRYFHYGVTSSDIIDSALTLQIEQSLKLIIPELTKLLDAFEKRIDETKDWLSMGRSHGMNAEPLPFAQKLLSHYAEFKRRKLDLERFQAEELTVQFSGAVGNYTMLSTELEQKAAKKLSLNTEPLSTQIIPRDRIAKLVSINALLAAAIERVAVEIRHLHHSDIAELHEGFKQGQKGSSIMPHKKNPISGENLSGLARVLKSHVFIALDNIVLWHERDISHSSAERLYLPDNFGILYYALTRLTSTIEDLVFHREVIEGKVKNQSQYLSAFFLHQLLKNNSVPREKLYPIVQSAAFSLKSQATPKDFFRALKDLCKKEDLSLGEIQNLDWSTIQKIYSKDFSKIKKRNLN